MTKTLCVTKRFVLHALEEREDWREFIAGAPANATKEEVVRSVREDPRRCFAHDEDADCNR